MPRPRHALRTFTLAALVALGLVAASSARAQAPAPRPAPAEDAGPLVTLGVLVTDEKGRYVDDVKPEELRVFEGGVEQKLAFARRDNAPLSYGLLVDNSHSAKTVINAVVATGRGFVINNRDGDETFVVRFVGSDRINIIEDFTSDKAALRKAFDAMVIEGGATALIDAVYLAAEHVADRGAPASAARRRVLVLLTDGEDRGSYYRPDDLFKRLRETDVQIFAVGFVGVLSDEAGFVRPSKRDAAAALLERLAKETGGRAYFPKKMPELEDAFAEIMRHLRGRYLVGYAPPARGDKSFRKVEVKVADAPNRGKRLAVARPGYSVAAAKKQ